MAKGKDKGKNAGRNVVAAFEVYFGEESKLENWQRFCADVGIENTHGLTSLKRCRMALRPIWINIHDFLNEREDIEKGLPDGQRRNATRFRTQAALAQYTRRTQKFYPLAKAKEDGPVKSLLAHICH